MLLLVRKETIHSCANTNISMVTFHLLIHFLLYQANISLSNRAHSITGRGDLFLRGINNRTY